MTWSEKIKKTLKDRDFTIQVSQMVLGSICAVLIWFSDSICPSSRPYSSVPLYIAVFGYMMLTPTMATAMAIDRKMVPHTMVVCSSVCGAVLWTTAGAILIMDAINKYEWDYQLLAAATLSLADAIGFLAQAIIHFRKKKYAPVLNNL